MGKPNLYDLRLEFVTGGEKKVSDAAQIRFGIRSITQYRDDDTSFRKSARAGIFI